MKKINHRYLVLTFMIPGFNVEPLNIEEVSSIDGKEVVTKRAAGYRHDMGEETNIIDDGQFHTATAANGQELRVHNSYVIMSMN